MKTSLFFLTLIFQAIGFAQVLGPSVQEVKYSYTAEFVTNDTESAAEDLAYDHANYMFGVMASPALIDKYGIDYSSVGGIGSPRDEKTIRILKFETTEDDRTYVQYKVSGKLLLHKKAAKKALTAGYINLPLPADMDTIYDKKCTDPHYTEFGDYWYFWDPMTDRGCQYLSRQPYSNTVKLVITEGQVVKDTVTARLDLLRGDNGNGSKLSIYVVNGFAESSKDPKDDGRLNFKQLTDYVEQQGFEVTIERKTQSRPLYIYTKTITLPNGKDVEVEIRHLLVETGIESRSTTFAKFFKEAVENADVIIYGGHSGLGGNLDIPSLESKAGTFKFNSKKRQIFYFDSCASYAYYLTQFSGEKTKSKIDILTNGLSSYFETSQAVLEGLLENILSETKEDVSWMQIMKDMEKPLDGGSFLLNVGGV